MHKTFFVTSALMSTIGFVRGGEYYYYKEIKNNNNVTFNTYTVLPVFCIINASLYANPVFYSFALYDEYEKIKMLIDNTYDEKKYYSSSFF
jgi:hypothetical protein